MILKILCLQTKNGVRYTDRIIFADLSSLEINKSTIKLELNVKTKDVGVMVLGTVSGNGNLKLNIIDDPYNSKKYIHYLDTVFLPWCKQKYGRKPYLWQHDNILINKSKITNEYLNRKNIEFLNWPAQSPDLNIIENVWSLIQSKLYNKKQFFSKNSL